MSYDVVAGMFDGLSGTMIALHEKLGITPKKF